MTTHAQIWRRQRRRVQLRWLFLAASVACSERIVTVSNAFVATRSYPRRHGGQPLPMDLPLHASSSSFEPSSIQEGLPFLFHAANDREFALSDDGHHRYHEPIVEVEGTTVDGDNHSASGAFLPAPKVNELPLSISIPKYHIAMAQDEQAESQQRQKPYNFYHNNPINHNNPHRRNDNGYYNNRSSFHQKQNSDQRLFHKSSKRQNFQKLTRERHDYLVRTTYRLLNAPPGSLVNGKHHELISMFHAWAKHAKETSDAPVFMEKVIRRMSAEQQAGNDAAGLALDIGMYNVLLDAWACVALFVQKLRPDDPQPAQRARELLVLLQSAYNTGGGDDDDDDNTGDSSPAILPNSKSFDIVFHAVCKTEGPIKARRLLAWMEYLNKNGYNVNAKPSRKQYVMLLNAYGNSREANAGQLAQAFLRHMQSIGEQPDTLCYNIAIKAWTKTRRGRESAEHAEQILEEMKASKDTFTYATVISAWAASGMRSHAVSRAEKLLRAMEEVDGLEANTIVLNTVMSTWVKSKSVGAVNRTEAMLRRMEQATSMEPDLISYNTHLHALSMHSSFSDDYASKAHDLLVQLESRAVSGEISFSPNLFSYNLVIEAWAQSKHPNAAFRAVETLRKLIHHGNLEPDTFSFNCAITGLSRSRSPRAARIAEELLQYMEDAYERKIHRKVRPDVVSYTTTMVALSRSNDPDAPERAQALLERMKARHAAGERYLKPNRMAYNALINTWAKSCRGTLAARRAEAVLKDMEELCALGDNSVSPNSVTYNGLINSWARSGTLCCGNKAESYLNRMWELYNNGVVDVKPDDLSFNTVINAISKSQHKSKAQKALRVLRRMDKLYQAGYIEAKPCTVSYTSVIQSCAFPASYDEQTRRKALDTAIFTLEELRSSRYGRPNQITYITFIKACANLLTNDDDDDTLRRSVIEKAFQNCYIDGLVDDKVLSHLRDVAPTDLYQRLLAEAVSTQRVAM